MHVPGYLTIDQTWHKLLENAFQILSRENLRMNYILENKSKSVPWSQLHEYFWSVYISLRVTFLSPGWCCESLWSEHSGLYFCQNSFLLFASLTFLPEGVLLESYGYTNLSLNILRPNYMKNDNETLGEATNLFRVIFVCDFFYKYLN